MGVDIPREEEMQMLRDTMVALLQRDPHCQFANLLGRRLADLIAEQS